MFCLILQFCRVFLKGAIIDLKTRISDELVKFLSKQRHTSTNDPLLEESGFIYKGKLSK
jgi:hypothetical protein